jgi:hypothetical protein
MPAVGPNSGFFRCAGFTRAADHCGRSFPQRHSPPCRLQSRACTSLRSETPAAATAASASRRMVPLRPPKRRQQDRRPVGRQIRIAAQALGGRRHRVWFRLPVQRGRSSPASRGSRGLSRSSSRGGARRSSRASSRRPWSAPGRSSRWWSRSDGHAERVATLAIATSTARRCITRMGNLHWLSGVNRQLCRTLRRPAVKQSHIGALVTMRVRAALIGAVAHTYRNGVGAHLAVISKRAEHRGAPAWPATAEPSSARQRERRPLRWHRWWSGEPTVSPAARTR